MTEYKLVPMNPTEGLLAAAPEPALVCKKCGVDRTKEPCKNPSFCVMVGYAQTEPAPHGFSCICDECCKPAGAAPLPDDVAMLVDIMRNRANCGVDGCKEAADMLESMSRELSVVQEENVKLRVQQIEYVDTSAEQQAKNEELREHMRELAATQLQLKEAREALREITLWDKPTINDIIIAKKALSRPADTTALNRYVAEELDFAVERVMTLYEGDEPPYLVDICKAIKDWNAKKKRADELENTK